MQGTAADTFLTSRTHSHVTAYCAGGPVWTLAGHSVQPHPDLTPDELDSLASQFERDARRFADSVRRRAARQRRDTQRGIAYVARATRTRKL